MEKAQTGTAHNSETTSIVLCVNTTDINELSKEKEEELLFGTEEEGDDEDTLSDDSLRLRLSDDDDAEQEDIITNHTTNISESKSQNRETEQPPVDIVTEKELCPGLQQSVEEVVKPSNEESLQKEHNSAIKTLENSALASDEYISENKQIEDNIHNSKNNNTISESNNECTSKSNKDLKITEVNNSCSIEISEQNIKLENDNLSTSEELTIHNESNLKEITSNNKEINSTNTCELRKVDNIDSNSSVVDSVKVQICISEKLSTVTTISNNNNDNLSDKVVDKTINDDDHSVKPFVEINNDQDFIDSVKSNSLNDLSSPKDSTEQEHKNKNPEHEDITQRKDVSKIQLMEKEMSTLLVQNEIDSPNVKGSTKIINEDHDNKPLTQNVNKSSTSTLQGLLLATIDVEDYNNENEIKNADIIVPRKKRSKNINRVQDHAEEDKQEEKDSGRQKRRTAKNAEEIIRKKYLNSDSDSSDDTEQFITVNHKVNHKLNHDIRPTSPPSLKRNYPDNEIFNGGLKKAKMSTKFEEKNDVSKLIFVEKFFQRDIKEKLPKLTQEELEELLIQKIAETITMRSEIGQLREQARISEKYQEVTRTKLQQLMKQVKDFEMVLNRNAIDRRANPDKPVAPIKINRSVGLQVNFITEHGVQNLRQVQQTSHVKPANVPSGASSPVTETNNNATSPRRSGIKIRSPRPTVVTTSTPTISQSSMQTPPLISTVTPAALVVAKPLESSHTLTLSSQPTPVQPILPVPQPQAITQIQQPQPQAIVLNGKIQNQINRPTLIKSRNSDLIDLTDEEEKSKSANVKVTSVTTTSIFEQQLNVTSKPAQSFQRVIQTIPANVAITQPGNIKVIAPNQPAPALVNNINPPRLAYVMQSTSGSPRQVLITSNANQQVQIRPATTCRPSFSAVTYKAGISTIANGAAVRVLTTPVLTNIQIKHPASLPDTPNYTMTPGWKLPPPAPSLKISKVSNGIVLSWNMNLSDKYADIASYQLYAYQEVAGVNPSTSLWKKVGDVRALPLPMACTLTQFSEGNNYYFAVRAVDTHSRKGQYSIPGNISL